MPQLPKKLDIEVFRGKVVALWLGCLRLPFEVIEVDSQRAKEMDGAVENTSEEEGYHAITECQRRVLGKERLSEVITEDEIGSREA